VTVVGTRARRLRRLRPTGPWCGGEACAGEEEQFAGGNEYRDSVAKPSGIAIRPPA